MGMGPRLLLPCGATQLSALSPSSREEALCTCCQDPGKHIFFPLSSASKHYGSAAREEPMPVGGPSAGCLGCTAKGQRQGQEGHGPWRGSRFVPENELTPGSPKNTRNLRPAVGPAGFPRKKRSLEGGVPGSGRLVAVGCPCFVSWKLGPAAGSQKPKVMGKSPFSSWTFPLRLADC